MTGAFVACASSGKETQGDDSTAGAAGASSAGQAGSSAGQAGSAGTAGGSAGKGGTAGSGGSAGTGGAGTAGNAGASGSGGAAACKLVGVYSSKNVACNTCAEQKCCEEINGCLGEVVCNDTYVNCTLACSFFPDDGGMAAAQACIDKCGVDAPDGKAAYDQAIGCADTKCASECQ